MHIRIAKGKYLTTAHLEACKDGIPVLVINGEVYRRDNILPNKKTAYQYVNSQLIRIKRRAYFMELFLRKESEYKEI